MSEHMKTIVEIYDAQQILNLVTPYMEVPEKVIFLYEKSDEQRIHNPVIHRYLDCEIEYLKVSRQTISEVCKTVRRDDTAFDIHGGNYFAIAAVSQIAEERGAELYYPDLETGKMLILKDGKVTLKDLILPKLTVSEMVALYGAKVRTLPEEQYDERGRRIVEACMRAKHRNNKRWVNFTKTIGNLFKKYGTRDVITTEAYIYREHRSIFEEIRDTFSVLEDDYRHLRFKLADPAYAQLLADPGVAFEYDTYYQLTDSNCFDDVDIRVNVDWNGGEFTASDPNSELDVMATLNSRMICISCKSGKYDQQAVYEVKANAEKFGGERAVPVLCTDLNENHPELVSKAEELGVLVIEYQGMWERKAVEKIMAWMKKGRRGQ